MLRANAGGDSTSAIDMMIFNQYDIVEAHSVIDSASASHSILLSEPDAWSGLASVENLALGVTDFSDELSCNRGDS